MIIGYTTGVFDLFHMGHLNLLKNAKAMCDKLIVGVTTDELVSYKNKNAIIPFEDRIEVVRNIKWVDAAIPQDSMDKMAMWEKIKFDIMFVGDDWHKTEKWKKIEKEFKDVNVRVIYFPYTKGVSSTLINEILIGKRKGL
jgi:glycerol-3-phosphate cytidylyltransferase